jgi:23S rRNA maturation mini-RNase III
MNGSLRLGRPLAGADEQCFQARRADGIAVFSNHRHFVAHSPEHEDSAESLSAMLGCLHEKTAKWINRLDNSRGRKVWHNFWETKLTYQKSTSLDSIMCIRILLSMGSW